MSISSSVVGQLYQQAWRWTSFLNIKYCFQTLTCEMSLHRSWKNILVPMQISWVYLHSHYQQLQSVTFLPAIGKWLSKVPSILLLTTMVMMTLLQIRDEQASLGSDSIQLSDLSVASAFFKFWDWMFPNIQSNRDLWSLRKRLNPKQLDF